MNFLRLCRYLYTKRLANEIILLIQLVCMIELSFVVLNPVDSFLADRANVTQAYTIDFNEVIHFSENNAMMSADIRGQEMPIDIIYQRIKETDGVKNILCFGFCNGLYTYRNPEVEENEQSNANLIVYSEEMMDAISLQLKEGEKRKAWEFMNAYHAFALVYDRMMEEIPYEEWCNFVTDQLKKFGIEDGLMLELGCGTGTLTEMFDAKGFDMIGVDNSEEMLAEAVEKREQSGRSILYLNQDMREFELYGTVRAVISLCDTMNYLTEYDDLVNVCRLVNNYLDPNGIFLFDLKTDHYFKSIGCQSFCDADEEVSFIWDNDYDEEKRINSYALTLFVQEEDNRYERFDEYHEQRAFSIDEVRCAIEESGMIFLSAIDKNGAPATKDTDRVYIIAREKGKTPLQNL